MKPLRELAPGAIVKGEDFNALLRYVRCHTVTGVGPGLGMKDAGTGIFINLTRSPLDRVHQGTDGTEPGAATGTLFFAKITGAVEAGAGVNQWEYNWQKVVKSAAGYGPGGWALSSATGRAYNVCEYMNSTFGVQGNGVDVDGEDFPDGFSIQPCPTDNIVVMHSTLLSGSDYPEYWFAYENGIDGTCS